MARAPEQRRPAIRLLAIALAIGLAVLVLIAALVWRPLVSPLHLGRTPARAGAERMLAADIEPVPAGAARAP